MAVGDFNSVTSKEETSSPLNFDHSRSFNMNNWISTHGVIDLGYSWPKFTWTRGKSPQTFKGARLDRALCNKEWSTCFPHAKVENLPKLNSDHSLVLLNLADTLLGRKPLATAIDSD